MTTRVKESVNVYKETIRFEEEDDYEIDYEQSLFFLGPSSKTPETRK